MLVSRVSFDERDAHHRSRRDRPIGAGLRSAQRDARSAIAPVTVGDEPIAVSEHTIPTEKGPLTYEARIGRLPIRSAETGEVRGRIFFVAYVVTPKRGSPPRPLTFAWNGGPGSASSILHMQGVGPRLRIRTDVAVIRARYRSRLRGP
jgi:carboxypeptidase C (cathepsin A)